MALAIALGVEHIPFGERPAYGSPYPEGIAVAFSGQADDASGGAHTFSINADGGFLYRLELFNYTRGESTIRDIHAISAHRWAGEATPFDIAGFDLNWVMGGIAAGGFSVYALVIGTSGRGGLALPEIRRFPIGSRQSVSSQQIFLVTNEVNTTGITNQLSLVFTYWRKESLFVPGFLSSFYESPAVPPLLRSPR